jgi:AraC-like DNA-binding protein
MMELGSISGAALNQYLASARARALDVDHALREAGVNAASVQDPDARIPGESFERLLETLIEASGDPLFGLDTARFIQPGSYNVMGYIAMSAATIGDALIRVRQYEQLVGDMGITETEVDNDRVHIRWQCRHNRQPVRRHLIDNVLASWVRYTRWLADNETLTPTRVLLEHPPPDPQLAAAYERVFGCPVDFDAGEAALITPASMLAHPLRQPDPGLLSTLEAHAAHKLEQLGIDTSVARQVREHLLAELERGAPGKSEIAARLGMNARTLHRRLGEEGTSWQRILDELRLERARALLRETGLPQARIAERLGYTDIRSFQRNFQRQSGETPGRYRRRATTDQSKS